MRIRFVPVSFVLSLALAPVGAAVLPQQRPSFTGTWASTTEAPAAMAAAPSAIMGARFALRLEGDGVVVTRPLRDDSLAVTLKLDGSRTSYTVPGRLCEGEPTSIETAAWEGDAMVLSSVGRIPAGGGATTTLNVKRTLRLTGPDTLVVQSTIVQAGETKPVATVYKRSADALAAPKATSAVKGTPATIAQLSWLPGVWIGVNGTTTTEERWTPTASGGTIGVSRTLRGEALGGFEFLCIVERSGSLVYLAMPDARFPPTPFTLTAITADSATFENPSHDYPQLIRYTKKADGSLETTVAGAGGQRAFSVALQRQK